MRFQILSDCCPWGCRYLSCVKFGYCGENLVKWWLMWDSEIRQIVFSVSVHTFPVLSSVIAVRIWLHEGACEIPSSVRLFSVMYIPFPYWVPLLRWESGCVRVRVRFRIPSDRFQCECTYLSRVKFCYWGENLVARGCVWDSQFCQIVFCEAHTFPVLSSVIAVRIWLREGACEIPSSVRSLSVRVRKASIST